MTAINAWAEKESATVYTDGAWVGDDGRVEWFAPKVTPLPHMDACMVVRGHSQTAHVLTTQLPGMFGSFDQVIAEMGPIMCDPPEHLAAAMGSRTFGKWQIMLLGYSKAMDSFAGAFMQGEMIEGEPTWKVEPFMRLASPMSPELAQRVDRFETDPGFSEAGAIMDQQRCILNTHPHGARGYVVGGFCQRTHLTPGCQSTMIVRRWSDEIGAPIRGPIMGQTAIADPFAEMGAGPIRAFG